MALEQPCDTGFEPLIPYDEAVQRLLDHAHPVIGVEDMPLLDCRGRVLAGELKSSIDVPPAANSAMDGYAVRSSDVSQQGTICLRVTQRIAAGATGEDLRPGEAARIFTGAVIPLGADAVIMQEHVQVEGHQVTFAGPVTPGQNVRAAAQDIARDQVILHPGHRMRAQDMGLAASIGIQRLPVRRRVRVAIFFTGDELVEPGQPLAPGQIYDSNRYTLNGLLGDLGCEVVDLGIVGDTLEQTVAAIARASQESDLVITSGGVSVGEEDHVRIALQQLGQLQMWRLKIKPGKPLAFATVGETAFFGLPGNPVSMFATFCLFVSPYIKKLQGRSQPLIEPMQVISDFDWPRPDRRREFVRVRLRRDDQNRVHAELYPNQDSSVLMSTSWADGFVDIAENSQVRRGDRVNYMSFREILE